MADQNYSGFGTLSPLKHQQLLKLLKQQKATILSSTEQFSGLPDITSTASEATESNNAAQREELAICISEINIVDTNPEIFYVWMWLL